MREVSRISKIYYGEVDSSEYSCFIYFDTNPPIPAEAEFFLNINGSWKTVFPNEINPGEYYQRAFDLKNGDNQVQLRIDYRGETFTSDPLTVPVNNTDEPEITPPREPVPPSISASDISVMRRVPCLIKYRVATVEPVIEHSYSEDKGVSWHTIEPTYLEGEYSFSKFYSLAGEYEILLRCKNNYWDVSDPHKVVITVKKGEGDEPGYHVTDTEDFVLQIAVPEVIEPETPTLYYVVNAATYTDRSLADNAMNNLTSKGYSVTVETHEV